MINHSGTKKYGYELFLILFSASAFYGLVLCLLTNRLANVDNITAAFILNLRNDGLTNALTFITYLGSWGSIVAVLIMVSVILIKKGFIKAAFMLVTTTTGSSLTNSLLKNIFHRLRPYGLRLVG